MKYYILFNPLAGSGSCEAKISGLKTDGKAESVFFDLTRDGGYKELLSRLEPDDKIILCGGDGTLNRFVNGIEGMEINNDILFFAAGSGNDFLHDMGIKPTEKPIKINDYIKNLPRVTIKDKTYRFINGIGLGVDGYCCKEVNRIHNEQGKKANYGLIALKGLIKAYTPVNATVTIDGEKFCYKKVWLASAMKGKYFGGGIGIAPDQKRFDEEDFVTCLVGHNLSRLKVIWLFLLIFKGSHTKYVKHVTARKCHEITVEFDRPTPLQIDGETILDVTSYKVNANIKAVL